MRNWDGHCHRCGEPGNISIMSRFNTDLICIACETLEKAHPDYKKAADAELAAVMRGERNFPGIGRPKDL